MRYPDFSELLDSVTLPRGAWVRQHFPGARLDYIPAAVRRELARPGIAGRICEGMRVCVAVGSRGILNLTEIVQTTVSALKEAGAEPFIVPAMGSHGGATAEGQRTVLAEFGITEQSVGAPIISSLDVVEAGRLPSGAPVYFDRHAALADAIVPINRVKPHTSFRAPVESGLLKMLAVGLGKRRGADAIHTLGFERMGQMVLAAGQQIIGRYPVAFGIAILENARGETARIEAVAGEHITGREPELLVESRKLSARIGFAELDVLVVDRMGKEISGLGMDPNVTGRYAFPWLAGDIRVQRLVALALTERSRGNACGVGLADIITAQLADGVDLQTTYVNSITSTNLPASKIPLIMPDARQAIALAIKTCDHPDPGHVRLVRIGDTLHLDRVWVSQALVGEVEMREDMEVLGPSEQMCCRPDGSLLDGMCP